MPSGPTVACTQCGGPVPLAGGERWVTCGHCRVPLALDLDRYVLHDMIRPRVGAGDVAAALTRFLREAEVEDPPTEVAQRLEYLPWFVVPADGGDVLVPGAPDVESGRSVRAARAADEGSRAPFDPQAVLGATVVEPHRTVADAVASVRGGRPAGARLVHMPVWRLLYSSAGARYTARIDAVTGDGSALFLPPPGSGRLDAAAIGWMALAGLVCAVVAALLPGVLYPLIAYVVLGFGAHALLRAGETRGAARP